jgi:hypothetical protein
MFLADLLIVYRRRIDSRHLKIRYVHTSVLLGAHPVYRLFHICRNYDFNLCWCNWLARKDLLQKLDTLKSYRHHSKLSGCVLIL